MRIYLLYIAIIAMCFSSSLAYALPPGKRDGAVEPTHRGGVLGRVYDAQTGDPIGGATVTIQEDGQFPTSGKAIGATDSTGRYLCETMLGRKASNLDIGRLLSSDLITGLVFGGATNQTKRVDITRLIMRVTRDGYHAFEGVVMCRHLDARGFRVSMEPIILSRADSPDASTTAEGWGVTKLLDVTISPLAGKPGERQTVTAKVLAPTTVQAKDIKVKCAYRLDGWSAPREIDLNPAKESSPAQLVYTGQLDVPKSTKPQARSIRVYIASSDYDIASVGIERSVLLQVAVTDEQQQSSAVRAQAFELARQGNNVQAAELLKALCEPSNALTCDLQALAEVSMRIHDNDTAVSALKRVADGAPPKEKIVPLTRYAVALASAGHGDRVLSECAPSVDAIKEKERPLKIPALLMVAVGDGYLQQGKLEEAEKVNRSLLDWPDADLYAETTQFRNGLRLAQAQDSVKHDGAGPSSHAELGRVLMDQGRWEEAVPELRASLQADANQPAVERDLGYALLHINGGEVAATTQLDDALSAAYRQVESVDTKGHKVKSKDFFTWHKLGILLYTKAMALGGPNNPAASESIQACRDALAEALKCGRKGADYNAGIYAGPLGYATPSLVAISGYAYPEANSDFVIRESLSALTQHPDDYLTLLNLGSTLLDLGNPELARDPLQRALKIAPDCVEAKYAVAMMSIKTNDRQRAKQLLEQVVKANPRHRYAYLGLARLYTEDGEISDAAACMNTHARMYGLPTDKPK